MRKALFSREGTNVELITESGQVLPASVPYADGSYIRQQFQVLPRFHDALRKQNSYTMIGSWVVGDSAAGICIREDSSLIT